MHECDCMRRNWTPWGQAVRIVVFAACQHQARAVALPAPYTLDSASLTHSQNQGMVAASADMRCRLHAAQYSLFPL